MVYINHINIEDNSLRKFKSIRTNALIKPFGKRNPVYLFKFFYPNVISAI